MIEKDLFAGLIGRSVYIVRHEHSWTFGFGDGWALMVQTLWRLHNDDRVLLTSEDDGHQFGLPKPVDAEYQANDILADHLASECHIGSSTGDLQIVFDGGITLDVISTSSGYEGWQANLGGSLIVGRGDGLITFENLT